MSISYGFQKCKPFERHGGGHNGSPPSIVLGGEWRGSLSGEELEVVEVVEELELVEVVEELEVVEVEEDTSETVGQWKIRPDGRKTRSMYSVKQICEEGF